jgi:hypothetical protein
LFVVLGEYSIDHLQERWKVALNCVPEVVEIDVEVGMNQSVAHTNHLTPRNLRY